MRKQDLAKLPTPVPLLQSGVSIKYSYPEFPQYIDAQQVSPSSSDQSMDKCVSTAEVVQKQKDKLGRGYSSIIPNSKSLPCHTYQDLYSDLLGHKLPPIADYALSDEHSSVEEEVIKELPERLAHHDIIIFKTIYESKEYEMPVEVKLTKKQVKKIRVKEEKTKEIPIVAVVEETKQLEIIRPSLKALNPPKPAPKPVKKVEPKFETPPKPAKAPVVAVKQEVIPVQVKSPPKLVEKVE